MSRFLYEEPSEFSPWRAKINEVIFGADTRAGKWFDVALIIAITVSVIAVLADSVESLHQQYGQYLYYLEWCFTVVFTIEYCLRIISVKYPARYIFSFYGIVDLVSILPTYLSLMLTGANSLLVIRILRILRIFRILKLLNYVGEAEMLIQAIRQSRRKILVFLYTVITIVVIFGATMYVVEGPAYGFTSIPKSIYWAIVTMTTVGYGDIAPQTVLGQFIASAVMICGYSIIAVPTGIYAAELSQVMQANKGIQVACDGCGHTGHDEDAEFCKFCGTNLHPEEE